MTNEQIAMVLSIVGMVITIVSFQPKKKRTLLLLQSLGSTFFLLSYIFSGAGLAVYLNVLFLIRNTIFMFCDGAGEKTRRAICIGLCVSYIALYAIYTPLVKDDTATRLWNTLPILAALFGTVAVLNTDVNKIRLWKYGDSVSWLAFNAHIGLGAIGGIVGELFNEISLAVAIFRYRKKGGASLPPDEKQENDNPKTEEQE